MESIIIQKLKLLPPECHKEVTHFIDTLPTHNPPVHLVVVPIPPSIP